MCHKYFETIKTKDYKVYNLKYHKQRIFNTIGKNLDFNITPTKKLHRIKLIYTKEKILSINYYPYKIKKFFNFKLISSDINYNFKYLNRNKLDNLKQNYDEIIIVKNNLITDTSIANIAIFYNNYWITPKEPLLKGTTRQRYLEKGLLFEEDITTDMLKSTSKIALLNAMIDFHIIEKFNIN